MRALLEEIRDGGLPASLPPGFAWRRTGAQVGVVFGMFALGPLAGASIAALVAPGSQFAQVIGLFALPVVFGGGYTLWKAVVGTILMRGLYRGFARALFQIVVRRTKPAVADVLPDRDRLAWVLTESIRAARMFARTGIAVGIVAGALMAIAAPDGRAAAGFLAMFAASALYGRALTRLAFAGYLMPPDE
jgi:hypothetical protein